MSERNDRITTVAAEIADAANLWIVIRDSVLSPVNRNQDAAELTATYREPTLLELSIKRPFPIRQVVAEWSVNRPYRDQNRLAVESRRALLEPLSYGQVIELQPLSTVEGEVVQFLNNAYDILRRPEASAALAGIYPHEIGDKIFCQHVSSRQAATITVSQIKYNFSDETTELSGHALVENAYA
jgi:hypothetical protein